MSGELEHVQSEIGRVMHEKIEPHFKNALVTVIARTPGNDKADFILTADTVEGLEQVLERVKSGQTSGDE